MDSSSVQQNKSEPANSALATNYYPLMRRVDQHFVVQDKLTHFDKELTRLSVLNKTALASIKQQEQRLQELRAFSRPTEGSNKVQSGEVESTETTNHHSTNEAELILIDADSATEHHLDIQCTKQIKPAAKSLAGPIDKKVVVQSFNVTLAEVTETSFTLTWVRIRHRLFDLEIKYSCIIDGKEEIVQRSCSRWAWKEPVPNGRLKVDYLNINTEYRDISIRFKNHFGWSEWSTPIKKICTCELAHDFQQRREQFLYRIEYIRTTIEGLKQERSSIPSQQKKLAQDMEKAQSRLTQLTAETERVFAIDDNIATIVSSPLLHGSRQAFTKPDLEKQLQKECVECRKQIAQWRADIIKLDQASTEISDKIVQEAAKLNERKAGLLKLEEQLEKTVALKSKVSHQSKDVLQYYFRQWHSKALSALEAKSKMESLIHWTRRRIYLKAWRKLQGMATTKHSSDTEIEGGIGQKLISAAETLITTEHQEASCLASELVATVSKHSGNVSLACPDYDFLDNIIANGGLAAFVPNRQDMDLLHKGSFYFRSGHYESSLKCFEGVLSKIASYEIDDTNVISITSALNGKCAQAHCKLEKYDVAIVYFNRQLSLAKEIDSKELHRNAVLGLGRCYHAKSEFEYALTLFQESLGMLLCTSTPLKEAVVYHYQCIEESLLNLNRISEAADVAAKMQQMTRDERREAVESAISQMDKLRQNLVKVEARKSSSVVCLDVASPTLILLHREKTKKTNLIAEYQETLAKSTENIEKLSQLGSQLKLEIDRAKGSKKNRLISRFVTGAKQEYKTAELVRRLTDQLAVVEAKRAESEDETNRIRFKIHNTNDEVTRINDRIATETGPLMQRVLKKRSYRCMAANPSNTLRNDVSGTGKGCIELVASTEQDCIYLHNISTGKLDFVFTGDEEGRHLGEINGHSKTITCLCWFGTRLFTGGMDHCVIGWCTRNNKKLFVARGHEAAVTCIYANKDQLLSGSTDKSIILWSQSDGTLLRRIFGHARGVHHVVSTSIPSSNLTMVSASYNTVFCWTNDISSTPTCHRRLELPQGNVTALEYGELEIITGDSIGNITLFWIESAEILTTIKAHEGPVLSLQVDSRKACSSGQDRAIQVVDLIRGVIIQTLRGHVEPIKDIAFDNTRIISLSTDGELRTWDWKYEPNTSRRRLELGDH